jgi:hypothetical protein
MPKNVIPGKLTPGASDLKKPPVVQAFGLAPRAIQPLAPAIRRNAGTTVFQPPAKPAVPRFPPPPAIQAFGLAPRAVQPQSAVGRRPGASPVYRPEGGKIVQPKAISQRRVSSAAPPVYRPNQPTTTQPAMILAVQASTPAKAPVGSRPSEAEGNRMGRSVAAHRNPVQAKPEQSFRKTSAQGIPFPFYGPHGAVVQRMEWEGEDVDYMIESSSDSEDISDADEEIDLTTSPNLNLWRAGVATGYNEGWDDGVNSERVQLNPAPTLLVALQTTGGPVAGVILLLQNNPPHTFIAPGDEQEEGEAYGRGFGFTAGAATAFRLLSWSRQNYPAIPLAARGVALAQNAGQCVYCNAAPSTTVDHVYPIQKHWVTLGYQGVNLGQVNDASNLVGSCGPCNGAKSNTYLNNWNGHAWGVGAWFPFGPAYIPLRRGTAIALGNW